MPVELRMFEPRDLDAVLELAVAAWQPIFASSKDIVGEELFDLVYSNPDERKRERITEASDPDDPREIWIAELDGKLAGFLILHMYPDRKVAEIGNNAVIPEFQGRGIGSEMYSFALQRMRDSGMKAAVVTTGGDDAHAPARRAYEKAGFSGAVPSVEYHIKL